MELHWLLPALALMPFAGGYLVSSPPRRARALGAAWIAAAGLAAWAHHPMWLATVVGLAAMVAGSRLCLQRCPAADFESFSAWRMQRHRRRCQL